MTTTELILSNHWNDSNKKEIKEDIFAQEKKTSFTQYLSIIASEELRENENVRRHCLAHFREWIAQNPDIENCITDDNFLLRFLRSKKFSIPMAEQMLLKYLNFRKRFRHLTYDMDYTKPKVNELISNGYIIVSPVRDSNGRRVIIYDISKFDLQKYNGVDLSRAHAVTYETLLDDEENQILGIHHVIDAGGAHLGFLTLFSITDIVYISSWGEQSFPMRHKEIDIINLPAPVKYVYDLLKTNVSQKLRDRLTVHDSKEQLFKKVDKRCLPLEFGGEIPAKKMIEWWKTQLAAKRKRMLSIDAINLLSDRGIIRRRNTPSQDDTGTGSLPGSFRKLDID